MKTKFLVILLLIFGIGIISGNCKEIRFKAKNEDKVDIYYVVYSNDDLTCGVVRGKKPYSGDIVIPSYVYYKKKSYKVTGIEESTFSYSNINSIKLPNTLEVIKEHAFSGCSIKSIDLPESVKTIKCGAFSSSLLESIRIPDSVTELGDKAFYNCKELTYCKISKSLKQIEGDTFKNCNKLRGIGISSLENWCTTNRGSWWKGHLDRVFEYSLFINSERVVNLRIPNTVNEIEEDAFTGCRSIKNVEIPSSVERIGGGAFWRCSNLESVKLPDNLKRIEHYTFFECSKLNNLYIPKSVEYIHGFAFCSCEKLTEISIDPENPFYCAENGVIYSKDMTKLVCYPSGKEENFVIPNSVVQIGDDAFYGCKNFKSITIPASVKKIGKDSFAACKNLKIIYLDDLSLNIPDEAFSDGSKERPKIEPSPRAKNSASWEVANNTKVEESTRTTEHAHVETHEVAQTAPKYFCGTCSDTGTIECPMTRIQCYWCGGSGYDRGSFVPMRCGVCGGAGWTICGLCGGTGRQACPICHGASAAQRQAYNDAMRNSQINNGYVGGGYTGGGSSSSSSSGSSPDCWTCHDTGNCPSTKLGKLSCHGSGKCGACGGSGRVSYQFGSGTVQCTTCNGRGICSYCKGQGKCPDCGGRRR